MNEHLPKFLREPRPDVYLGDNYLVLDFEVTNHEYGSALNDRNSLLLACWSLGASHPDRGEGKSHSAWADEFGQHKLAGHIERAEFVVAHNSKFEFGWLRRCGVDLRKMLPFCTMIGEKVLAGNRKTALGLDATATRRGLGHKASFVSSLIKNGVCPSQIPAYALEDYCRKDVSLTEQIFLEQRLELAALALLPVAYCRNLVTPVLADIEFNGMTLDQERVEKTFDDYSERYASLEEQFSALTGGINVKSPKQMGEYLYGTLGFNELADYKGRILKTASGAPRTDKATLTQLKAATPAQKAFLKVALDLVKLKTPMQNLTKMQKICTESPDDPRVFAIFNQTVTQTDRLSSTSRNGGFQFQNFDRAFKPLFQARGTGRVLCEGDGSQLEFRVAAFLGNDANAKSDIAQGVDVHAITASTIGCDRQTAKAFTFKPLFGGNSGTPREKRYFEYFKRRYSGIAGTQDRWAMAAASGKRTVAPWGWINYWPDAEVTKTGYVTGQTQIYNYFIQSFATADIIPLVLCLVWHRIADMEGVTLVNTVHDSIIAEVISEVITDYQEILVECFTKDIYPLLERLYGITFDVPLAAGVKSALHWGEGEETKYEPLCVDNKVDV